MATGLWYQQWNIYAKTLAPLPYLPSPSPLNMIFYLKEISSSSTNHHVGKHSDIEWHAGCGFHKNVKRIMLSVCNIVEINSRLYPCQKKG